MKKLFTLFILLAAVFLSNVTHAFAVSPTPKPTVTTSPSKAAISEKLNEQINQLKEKIASRVSELNLVEKRGMIGTVTEVSGSKITIKDIQGNTRFVDVDEITKFSSASNKSFGLSDISNGTRISVLGLYNKQSKRILARFINTSIDPVFINGTVSAVDSKNFFLMVKTSDQKEIKLDVQTSSKIYTFDKEDGLVKFGFSKIEVGDHITAIGYPDKKDPAIIVPNRIIDLTNSVNTSQAEDAEKPASKSGTTR